MAGAFSGDEFIPCDVVYGTVDSDEALAKMNQSRPKADKLTAFYADPYTLQLDLDGSLSPQDVLKSKVYSYLVEMGIIDPRDYLVTLSKSGNYHLYLPLLRHSVGITRIALQAMLGSDPVREAHGYERYRDGYGKDPSCLFETPINAERVKAWLARMRDPRHR